MISVTTTISTEWPFVGRSREIAMLKRMLTDPRSRGVVIAASAGVGKTRVAQECLRTAEAAGFHTARATATAGQRDVPLAALSHLIPSQKPGTLADRADLLRQAQWALLEPANHNRLVLLVDDAHLLDDTSATLIYQLIVANQAFVILTVRAEEPAPDALVMAWKDDFVERIELTGLDDAEVGDLLGTVLGHVDPDAVSVLAHHAEQNILVLRELVIGAVRDETLTCTEGLWRLSRPLTPSARLIELIESRLQNLDSDDRALAEIVAVGEPLTLRELTEVADPGHAEQLERQGILVSDLANPQFGGEVGVRLAHSVYGEVIRARLPGLRMRSIAGLLADTMERSAPTGPYSLMRLGRLRLLSGGGDSGTLLAAAQAARWSYAFPFAESLARAALRAGAGVEAELLAAELAGLQGRWQDADEQLRKLATSVQTDAEHARVAIARMDNYLFAGLAQEQLEVAHEADSTVTDQNWRDEIRARSSPVLVMTKGPRATWSAVRGLLERGSGTAYVWATLTGAHAQCRMGATSDAIALTEVGYRAQLALSESIAWYPWFHLFNRCEAMLHAGQLAEAEALGREQHRRAVADHSAEAQACFASQLALVLVARGRVESATRYAREAFVIFQHLGRPMFMRQSAQRLAAALTLAGRLAEAQEGLQAAARVTDPAFMYDAVDLLHTRAWVTAAEGHYAQARDGLSEVVRLADEIGDLVGLSIALHSSARLCANSGEASHHLERLSALAPRLDGTFFPARLEHVRGLASEDPETLWSAAQLFAGLGADLLAAESAADAATRWQVQGEPRRCAAASQYARSLLSECEGAVTPALRSLDSRSTLTAAERDTAELAARGHSNKAIAEELVLSVRSVENRLQRAYEKLGINSREGLESALQFDRS